MTAALSILLGSGAVGLPEFLLKMGVQLPEEAALLIRISVPLTLWCVGSLIVLSLVIRYSRKIPLLESENHPLVKLTAELQDDVASLTKSVQDASGRLLREGVPMEKFYHVPPKRS